MVTARLHRQLATLDKKVGSEVREPTLRIGGRVLGHRQPPGPGATGPRPPRPPGAGPCPWSWSPGGPVG